MRYLSVCSGIEAASVAWECLGWTPVAFSEIDRFPSQVLAHHYPNVPNWGDMTKFKEWPDADVDVLVGGTPCQSFSVAGLRQGLADPRGNLMLTYLGIAARYRPQWVVWENVPGVLSSGRGRDFGAFLGALGKLGYGFAYRVLDAQYFGVAQRRRRVFVVGYLGDWRPAAAVLFERESMSGHPAPSREARQSVAPAVVSGPPFSRTGNQRVECDAIVTAARMVAFGEYVEDGTASAMKARDYKDATDLVAQPIHYRKSRRAQSVDDHETWVEDDTVNTLNCFDVGDVRAVDVVAQPIAIQDCRAVEKAQNGRGWNDDGTAYTVDTHATQGVAQPIGFNARQDPDSWRGRTGPLDTDGGTQAVAQPFGIDIDNTNVTGHCAVNISDGVPRCDQVTGTLDCWSAKGRGSSQQQAVMQAMQVRRLTPTECERLQGFPDGYTDIKDNTPDGPRYKALGNSMAVPVMRWIGQRISNVNDERRNTSRS